MLDWDAGSVSEALFGELVAVTSSPTKLSISSIQMIGERNSKEYTRTRRLKALDHPDVFMQAVRASYLFQKTSKCPKNEYAARMIQAIHQME